ncbi:sce7726 family protein [Pseudoalteromonas sp. S2755]|uniref:sce7726 family protein n=1 Tax=Pseudoalteromonas sp. S2755 TaxID=2066523 RepID=UPI00110C13D6|nr:sce7726 family protein [Pseudoalteromonas sp. S2755]TMN38843.1 hypothetical protein CWC03_10875 [Pseudoalteromonas sp. S2755]
MFKESEFKAAAIDWLIARGELCKDAVLINELPVDDFSRRADLVVANGKLQAFEIKSDADSLTRLEGQIQTYLTFFDKVTLICSPKFTEKAKQILPPRVEVVELNFADACTPKIKIRRRGKIDRINTASRFLSFVDKRELVRALRNRGIACSHADTLQELYGKYSKLPITFWRSVVLEYLKSKYKVTHDNFVSARGDFTSIDDLDMLSPNKLIASETLECTDDAIDRWDLPNDEQLVEAGAVDVTKTMKQFGMISEKPVFVIPRVKKSKAC